MKKIKRIKTEAERNRIREKDRGREGVIEKRERKEDREGLVMREKEKE